MHDPIQKAAELARAGKPFVMVTVAATRGSGPREAGAKLVLERDGAFCGTIGGGALEHAILTRREEWFALKEPSLLHFDLKPDLRMECGGAVDVLVEPFGSAPRLVLFGAGHVAIPVAALARQVGFRVVVVDDRPEWANQANFPTADQVVVAPLDGSSTGVELDGQDLVVVMTRGHAFDLEMADAALRRAPRYLGVIGSRTKAATMLKRLGERGHSPEAVASVRVPVGVDIGSQTPEEIAVSVVAQLISVRRKGA
jgi:xanthine dehydrogenase accessory factor